MLTIRAEQMRAFQETSLRAYQQRLETHLNEVLGIPVPRLQSELPPMIKSGSVYGMRRECDIARYCELIYRYAYKESAENLSKAARSILLAYGVESAEKLNRFEQWASLQGRGDAS